MAANTLEASLEEAVGAVPRRKMSGKKLVLFVVLPVLALAGGGAALYATGAVDRLLHPAADPAAAADPAKPGHFYDLPEIIVNLSTAERRQVFLKITPTLELNSPEDVARIERVLPRIIDHFQVYLRELQIDDLRGSAGMYRLREELLRRVNGAVHPVRVREVLFREMLLS